VEVLRTERLTLSRVDERDAAFILELVNDPDWLRNIGDRGVRTLEDARQFLRNGPMAMYERVGFGLYRVALTADGTPIGLCGLLRRDTLDDVDLGFAFLPAHRGKGYAHEAAAATLRHGREQLGLARIVAIVSPGNDASIRLLRRLGMDYERTLQLSGGADEVLLFVPKAADPDPSRVADD